MPRKYTAVRKNLGNCMEKECIAHAPRIKSRITKYIHTFYSRDEEMNAAVRLKEEHTKRVAKVILTLADDLGLDKKNSDLAEIIACLHDIGRFKQFARYKTFVDRASENHALLGVDEIRKNDLLKGLPLQAANLVVNAVSCHNRAQIPDNTNKERLLFVKLIRDADKIDILKVVTDYYAGNNTVRSRALELDLPDTAEISPDIYDDVIHGRIGRVEKMRSLSDFKVLQMGWVFDINFPGSFRIIKRRKYLEKIHASLPKSSRADTVYTITNAHLERKCGNDRPTDPLRQ
ncbi:MAG: HD domain-containing protein [Chitinivibrionales bacterium]|nr:HD domain-containing protein [Chitinivibrionales bacterium]